MYRGNLSKIGRKSERCPFGITVENAGQLRGMSQWLGGNLHFTTISHDVHIHMSRSFKQISSRIKSLEI